MTNITQGRQLSLNTEYVRFQIADSQKVDNLCTVKDHLPQSALHGWVLIL